MHILQDVKTASQCSGRSTPFGHSISRGSQIRERLSKALSKRRNNLLPHHLGRKTTKTAADGLGTQFLNSIKGLDWKAPAVGAGLGAGIGLLGSKKNRTRGAVLGAAAGGLAGAGMSMLTPPTPPPAQASAAPPAAAKSSYEGPSYQGVPTQSPGVLDRMMTNNSSSNVAPGMVPDSVSGVITPAVMSSVGGRASLAVPTVIGAANDLSAAAQEGNGNIVKGLDVRSNNLLNNKPMDTDYGKELTARIAPEVINYFSGSTPVVSLMVAGAKHIDRLNAVNKQYSEPVPNPPGSDIGPEQWRAPTSSAYGEGPNQLLQQAQKLTAGLNRANPQAAGRFAYEVHPDGRTILRDVSNQVAVPRNQAELAGLRTQNPASAQQILDALKQYLPERYAELTTPQQP